MEKDIIKQNVGIDISKDNFKVCFFGNVLRFTS